MGGPQEEAEAALAEWRRSQKGFAAHRAVEPGLKAHAKAAAESKAAMIVSQATSKVEQIIKHCAVLSCQLEEIEAICRGLAITPPGTGASLSSAFSGTLLPLLNVKDGLASLAASISVPAHRPPNIGSRRAAEALRARGFRHSQIARVLRDEGLVDATYTADNVRDLLRVPRRHKPGRKTGKK
jgi:hypothetical protein